jgi:hypothetical protein
VEINKSLNGFTHLRIHQEVYKIYIVLHFFKKEMKFYDVDTNLNYFVKFFDYLGYMKTDYAYEDSDSEYEKMCFRYYISKKLELYSAGLLYLWEKFNIKFNFNRAEDLLKSNVYEQNIELYFNNVISELRAE